MVSALISRIVILGLGTLYPAYASYKAVKTKNVKEYVKWMMYWIVFALFTCVETFADIFIAFWVPFYYELKILFVLWLLSPATKGASILYRKFVHPQFSKHEQEIDECLARAKEQGYTAIVQLGHRGLTYASNVVMQTALMGQATLVSHLRKSYSMSDLGLQQQYAAAFQDTQHGFDFGPEGGPQNMLITHKWQSEGVLIEEIEETAEEVSERPTRSRSRGHQTSSDSGEGSSTGTLTRTRSVPKSSSKGSQHSSSGGQGKTATHTEVTAYATLPRTGKSKSTKRKQQHSKS